MRTAAPALLPMFRSDSQVDLLGLVLLQPDRTWTLDELTALIRAPTSSTHRELQRLVEAGLVVRDERQRPHLYRAATSSPAYEPLSQLLRLTSGVPERLRQALSAIQGVRAAAIHGSWARGRIRPDSDIDVFVLADDDRATIQRSLRRVGREVGREIDASIVAPKDYDEMRATRNPLLMKILEAPRVNIVGDLSTTGQP